MTQGWICVHRKLLEWEWFDDHNAFRLFVYFMLKANHKDKKWKGITIKRGQHLTSLDAISSKTGLTKSQVRTSIKKLKSTHEIAYESNKQHTVITVINYDLYQDSVTQVSTRIAHESHTNRTRVTPNNNDNNKNNVNNNALCQQIADEYNKILFELGEVKALSEKRKSMIKSSIKQMSKTEHDFTKLETWSKYFNYVSNSEFLTGQKSDWSAGFDFLINKNNLLKVVEGKYE